MPSIARYETVDFRGRRQPSRRQAVHRRARRVPRDSFVKGTNRKPLSQGSRSNGNTLKVNTYSNKQETLDIEYRCMLDFSNMGGENGSTPTLIRVNLNNPLIGGPGTPTNPNDVIVTCIQGQKTGHIDPTYKRFALDNATNLYDRLQEYLDIYQDVVVLKSEAKVRVVPKLNQVNGFGSNRSVVNYLSNYQVPGQPASDTVLRMVLANAMSEAEIWTVKQQSQGLLTNPLTGTPPLENLKENIPALRMQRINVTPEGKRGVTYKTKYTPRSMFNLKDWKDNIGRLDISERFTTNVDDLNSFMYLGIAGRRTSWNGTPGATPTVHDPASSLTDVGLPLFKVEVVVKYTINFSNRYNIDGANKPIPHREDL